MFGCGDVVDFNKITLSQLSGLGRYSDNTTLICEVVDE